MGRRPGGASSPASPDSSHTDQPTSSFRACGRSCGSATTGPRPPFQRARRAFRRVAPARRPGPNAGGGVRLRRPGFPHRRGCGGRRPAQPITLERRVVAARDRPHGHRSRYIGAVDGVHRGRQRHGLHQRRQSPNRHHSQRHRVALAFRMGCSLRGAGHSVHRSGLATARLVRGGDSLDGEGTGSCMGEKA